MLPDLRTGVLDAVVMESWTHAPTSIPPGTHIHTLATAPATRTPAVHALVAEMARAAHGLTSCAD